MNYIITSSIVFIVIIMISAWIISKQNRKIRARLKKLEDDVSSIAELTAQSISLLGQLDESIKGKDELLLDYAVYLGEVEVSQHETADEAKAASELATQRTGALHDWGVSKLHRM